MSFPEPPVYGLPASLQYYPQPPSLREEVRSYSVHIPPDGITTMTSNAAPSPLFVANSTCAQTPFGGGQVISFTIPTGMSPNVFANALDTTISFSGTYTCSSTGSMSGGLATSLNLISSAASFFSSLQLYSNNVPIETIAGYDQLQHFLLQNTVNIAERWAISSAMGCDSNSNTGMELGLAPSQVFRYSFTLPLMSIIGYNTDKLIPVGAINNLQLQMTIQNGAWPIASYCTTVPTTQITMGAITLDQFSLNMKYIDVGETMGAALRTTLNNGHWKIKSTTYTQSSANLPAGSNGTQQLMLQIRNSSIKSILHYFNKTSDISGNPNGIYDAIGINTSARQLQIGANYYPSRPLSDVNRSSEAFCYLIQSLTGTASVIKNLGVSYTKEQYQTHVSAGSAANESNICVVANCIRSTITGNDSTMSNAVKWPSSAFYGYDTEKIGGTLLSGVSSRSAPPFLNLTLQNSLLYQVTCSSWAMCDVIVDFDLMSQTVTAYI